ncbi:MAG: hypothetical protein D6771_06680, partial [Zetaproteobacteria bacterium]
MIGKGFKRRFYAMVHLWCEREIQRIIAEEKQKAPDTLLAYGRKIYSQCDEDGIIAEIFRRIGTSTRICVEIGCGCGLENNTHALLLSGWRGVWIDADKKEIARLLHALDYDEEKHAHLLAIACAKVTPDNAVDIVRKGLEKLGDAEAEPDFISVDIDSYDLPVVEALLADFRPRAWCVEYNAKFPPPMRVHVPYEKDFAWREDDDQGASLAAWVALFAPHGYRLVGCSIAGTNAFFVREDLSAHFADTPWEALYQPPRYYLVYRFAG